MKRKVLVFIGTKAILLKMSPVIRELARAGQDFAIVDTGQHADLAFELAKHLDIPAKRLSLATRSKPVARIGEGLVWLAGLCRLLFRSRSWLQKQLFQAEDAVALVHGDTASTLLACLLARRAGYPVIHIESGLRSFNYLNPFPEELIRVWVMRCATTLIPPSKQALANIQAMGLAEKAVYIEGNTGIDAARQSLEQASSLVIPFERYAVVTLHRMENIYSARRFEQAMAIIQAALSVSNLVFVTHKVTEHKLLGSQYRQLLEDGRIHCIHLVDHSSFLHLINNAEFLMTDGGSIQEEASYLGIPCLVLREFTERQDGLGDNVVLSKLDISIAKDFFEKKSRKKSDIDSNFISPSKKIVEWILN